METNYEDTHEIIEAILSARFENATMVLNSELKLKMHTHPQFYDGVIKHGPKMNFTRLQWFDFHCKIRHWRLLEEKSLMDKLSPSQREELGLNENPQ